MADQALAAHLPRYVTTLLASGDAEPCRPLRKRAAVMFCDVSGFTPLSETLARQGKAGTEALTVHLNDYFETLLGVVEAWGGDTVKFGGDAVTVLFEGMPGEAPGTCVRQAAACALDIFGTLGEVRTARTPWGDFPLSLKVGLSAGECLTGLVGDPAERMEHVLAGDALDRMAEAEHHARPGWAVVDAVPPEVAAAVLDAEPLGDGFARLRGLRGAASRPPAREVPRPPPERVRPFLLPAVWGQIAAGSESMLGEHRPVATVFAAFPGLDYADPGSLARLNDYFLRVTALLKGFGGSFNRMDMGDKGSKFLAFFGAPESYEDNEERAVAFALALQSLDRAIPWARGQRAGLSLGTNFCGTMGSSTRREYTVMGDAVNVAARLMGAARPGQVLVTEAVRAAARERFHWGPYKSLTLKGKSKPIKVSQPLSAQRRERARTTAHRAGLVGREVELSALRRAAPRKGRGGAALLLLEGEAGMGKTALLEEFLEERSRAGVRVALGACASVNPAPFQVWVGLFRDLLGEGGWDLSEVEKRLRDLLPDQEEFLGLALRFLGAKVPLSRAAEVLEGTDREEKTADLLARSLGALAARSPLILALDDWHAADAGSAELLPSLFSRLRGAPVLVVVAARPGAMVPAGARRLPLTGLSSAASRLLAVRQLEAERIPGDLAEFLEERSGGNPLFILELIGGLRDRGYIRRDRESRILFDRGGAVGLPGTVEGVVLARIDRMPLVTRNVLKVAACLGMGFDADLLQAVFLPEMSAAVLEEHLAALAELGVQSAGGGRYLFPHATLRDAAYGAVLLANRRSIHRRAAEALEARPANRRGDAAVLAYHFGEGGEFDRALGYGLLAARAFKEVFAYREAVRQYAQVEVWAGRTGKPLPPEECFTYAFCAEQTGAYDKARELVAELESRRGVPVELRNRSEQLMLKILDSAGAFEACLERAGRLLEEEESAAHPEHLLRVTMFRTSALLRLARMADAASSARELRRFSELPGLERHLGPVLVLEGSIAYQVGRLDQARQDYEEALARAREARDYPLSVRACLGLANVGKARGDWAAAAAHAQEALRLARQVGSPFNIIGAATVLATALNWSQKPKEAYEVLEEVRPLLDPEKDPYAACAFWNQMGVVHYFLSEHDKAVRCYRKCRAVGRRIGSRQWLAESSYNVADARVAQGRDAEALKDFLGALRGFDVLRNVPWFVQTAKDLLAVVERLGDEAGRAGVERRIRAFARRQNTPAILADLGFS